MVRLSILLLISGAAAFVGRAPAPRGGTTLCAEKSSGLHRRGFGASVASVGLTWALSPATAAAKDKRVNAASYGGGNSAVRDARRQAEKEAEAARAAVRAKQAEERKAAFAELAAKRKVAQQESIKLADAAFQKERQKVIKGTNTKYPKSWEGLALGKGTGWRDTPEGAKLIKISANTL